MGSTRSKDESRVDLSSRAFSFGQEGFSGRVCGLCWVEYDEDRSGLTDVRFCVLDRTGKGRNIVYSWLSGGLGVRCISVAYLFENVDLAKEHCAA